MTHLTKKFLNPVDVTGGQLMNIEEGDSIIMVCLHVFETKNYFIYMTKILLLLIKLVCDTTWLSSYFNTISKTLPWYINELIVNLI